ncbi:hypothetical protein DL98DRAFT_389833, partial [Cadophora sp. DSE1049]
SATAIPKLLVDHVGHENSIIDSATGIFREADGSSVCGLIDEVLRRSPDLINPEKLLKTAQQLINRIFQQVNTQPPVRRLFGEVLQGSLDLVNPALDLISPESLLKTVQKLTTTILKAAIAKVGRLPIIRDGIFNNDVNAATLGLIWSNGADLARFFVDLVEPAKCYVPADSPDGIVGQNNSRGEDNELDLSKAMNRHAAICQFQRLAKSIIFIVKGMPTAVKIEELDHIGMTDATTLWSDVKSGKVIVAKPPGEQLVTNEKWLFVNGIAGELHWLRLACEKLAKSYSRDIMGVFNRGDGILWDLVECAGERSAQGNGSAASQKRLIQRTKSSKEAQKALKMELEEALKLADGTTCAHVVMIAHSQGCLLLRLVLEELVRAGDQDIREAMLNRLCIFTFGNPSIDWKLETNSEGPNQTFSGQESKDLTHLSSHVLRTEHFANKEDFVAKLGVLCEKKPENSGFADDCVFINKKERWIGHLFGTQYSLNPDDYKDANGQNSWLLTCQGGRSMED